MRYAPLMGPRARSHFPPIASGAVLMLGLGTACSSTSTGKGTPACAGNFQACIGGQVSTAAEGPWAMTTPPIDGKGTFYAALIDACPTLMTPQFSRLSRYATLQVDLTGAAQLDYEVGFNLRDPSFGTNLSEGDTVVLAGFLDDDESSAGAMEAAPNFGDTVSNCIDVKVKKGRVTLTSPLVPCLYFTQTDAFFFDQGPFATCPDFGVGVPADGGT